MLVQTFVYFLHKKNTAQKSVFRTVKAFKKKTLIKANIPPLYWYLNSICLC